MTIARYCMGVIAAFIAVLAAPAANAAWYEAQSDNFVIYADDSERDIRRFSENLERYHRAMEIITGRTVAPPSPSNRVVIFVVGNQRQLRRVLDTRSRSIGGMYIPRAGASRAYVQDIRNRSGGYPHFSTVILLHEYAHHFLISTSRFAMPRWMSEGAAEFFASAIFNRDGSISIGLPAQHRANELYFADPVSVHELFDPELYEARRGRGYDAFYGRSWLLYHFLQFTPSRTGQMNEYWNKVRAGENGLEAAEEVFGDLDVLQLEVENYMRSRGLQNFGISAENLPIGEVTLRRLSRGEAEMMPIRMASQRGVTRERALELLEDARDVAREYPSDAGVLAALAESEYDAGNDAEAIAAADAAMAIDPARTNPYVQKGFALFRMAAEADDPDAAYAAAMGPMQDLNARENDHPIPLIYFYRSYIERGEEPSDNARAALERAAVLAPFDQNLWLQVAIMQAGEGKIDIARASLEPLTANPHGGRTAIIASAMVEALEDVAEGEQFALGDLQSALIASIAEMAGDDEEEGEKEGGEKGADDSEDADTDPDSEPSNLEPLEPDEIG